MKVNPSLPDARPSWAAARPGAVSALICPLCGWSLWVSCLPGLPLSALLARGFLLPAWPVRPGHSRQLRLF